MDVELYGEWDVNDHLPSISTCRAAGIDSVELVFFRPGELEEFTSPELRFACDAGFYDSGTKRVMSAGSWDYRWRAYEGDEIVLQSNLYSATGDVGDEVTLHAVNFLRLVPIAPAFALRWQTDLGFGSCSDAFAATMSWELRKGSNVGAVEASQPDGPCATSLVIPDFPSGSLTAGAHVLIVHGASMDGAVWSSECVAEFPEGGSVSAACDVARAP